jgi:hypothetical protein
MFRTVLEPVRLRLEPEGEGEACVAACSTSGVYVGTTGGLLREHAPLTGHVSRAAHLPGLGVPSALVLSPYTR